MIEKLQARLAELKTGEAGLIQIIDTLRKQVALRSDDLIATRAARAEIELMLTMLAAPAPAPEPAETWGGKKE